MQRKQAALSVMARSVFLAIGKFFRTENTSARARIPAVPDSTPWRRAIAPGAFLKRDPVAADWLRALQRPIQTSDLFQPVTTTPCSLEKIAEKYVRDTTSMPVPSGWTARQVDHTGETDIFFYENSPAMPAASPFPSRICAPEPTIVNLRNRQLYAWQDFFNSVLDKVYL